MFHSNKASTMKSHDHQGRSMSCVQGDSGLVLTTDPKPRLRWTAELHERFVDAVSQLGGPEKATPKTIMRVMGVKGLTLYHLKSHLQKFRLGKQPHKEYNDHSMKDGQRVAGLDLHGNSSYISSSLINHNMNEARMDMQRRILHEQIEFQVQRHLQLRIEAQGKYLQSILEKACQTQGEEASTYMKGNLGVNSSDEVSNKGFSFPSYFHNQQVPSFQQQGERNYIPINVNSAADTSICLGKKRPNSFNNNNDQGDCSKRPLLWSDHDHLHMQEIGTSATSCQLEEHNPFKGGEVAPQSTGTGFRSIPESLYECNPDLPGNHGRIKIIDVKRAACLGS